MIAACGLDCSSCDIRLAPFDSGAAERLLDWFHQMGWLTAEEGMDQVIERRMICQGCHGDRAIHWSASCWILQCCVDDHGLEHCDQCEGFPCQRLISWSEQNESYGRALGRLRAMWEQRSGSDMRNQQTQGGLTQ